MMKTTILCFGLALSVLPSVAYPQTVEPTESSMQTVNIKSPEAASFEKIGEIPVSLFTGVPQISIPLYEIDCGGYSFPITLDYQATAIKVNQEASWVGLNWLLNAGGAVTTRISKPEGSTFESQWDLLLNKMQYDILTIDSLGQGYKVSGSHEGTSGNYGWNRFAGSTNSDEVTNEFYSKLLDNYEGEALTFSANFMGYSFNFVYHPLEKRYIITGNDRKFKIEGSPVYVSKITDDKGIKYYFDEIETNNPASYRTAPYQKLNFSYYLTKIEYPNGRSVKLSYFKNLQSIRILPSVMESWNYGLPVGANFRLSKKLSDLVELNSPYLQKIEADGVVIEFVLGTRNDLRNARRLERGECLEASPLARGNEVANEHRHGLRRVRPQLDGYDRQLELLRHRKGVAQRQELAHVGLLGEPPLASLELGAHLGGVRSPKLTQLDGGVVRRERRGAHLHVREPVPLEVTLARPVEQDAAARQILVQRLLERKELVLTLQHQLNSGQVEPLDALGELAVRVMPHDHVPSIARLVKEPHELGLYVCLLHLVTLP